MQAIQGVWIFVDVNVGCCHRAFPVFFPVVTADKVECVLWGQKPYFAAGMTIAMPTMEPTNEGSSGPMNLAVR